MPSLTVENYVKAIYLIESARPPGSGPVGTGELAASLAVSPGTVTGMLKTLSESGLATYAPYEGVRLTDPGRVLALRVLRRHRLIELFLAQTLKLSWDEVHEEAENMEHAVSDWLVDRIDEHLGFPLVDPHGDPIPAADGSIAQSPGVPLVELDEGARFRVVRVVDQDGPFLRYLTECGLDLGTVGILAQRRDRAGAVILDLGDNPVALGWDAAAKVLVVRIDPDPDPPRRT